MVISAEDSKCIKEGLANGKTLYAVAKEINKRYATVRAHAIRHNYIVDVTPPADAIPVPGYDGYVFSPSTKETFSNMRRGHWHKLSYSKVGERLYVHFVRGASKVGYSLASIMYACEHGVDPAHISRSNLTVTDEGKLEDLSEVRSKQHESRKRALEARIQEETLESQVSKFRSLITLNAKLADIIEVKDTASMYNILETFRGQAYAYLSRIGYTRREYQDMAVTEAIDGIVDDLLFRKKIMLVSHYTVGAYAKKAYAKYRRVNRIFKSIDELDLRKL